MLFFALFLGVTASIYGYTGWRYITPSPLSPEAQWGAWVLVLLLYIAPIALMQHRRRRPPSQWSDAFAWLTYTSMGLIVVNWTLLLGRDLVWLAWQLGTAIYQSSTTETPLPDTTLILQATNPYLFGLATILGGYGFYQARRLPRVRRVEVHLKDLPTAFDGFTIAQLSDLHLGPTIKRPFVKAIVQEINQLQPDLIAFTGDLADGSVEYLYHDSEPLGQLSAPDGVFFVTGNHEYYSGAEAWIARVRQLGITTLLNQHQIIERDGDRLLIAGINDHSAADAAADHRSDPAQALNGAPTDLVKILLAHQPQSVAAAAEAGFNLQLSGHTHGGQFIPWKYVIPLQQPFTAGLDRWGETWIYTSRGTGYWGPPLRLGAPSEITQIVLRKP